MKINAGKFCSRACRNAAHPNPGRKEPRPEIRGERNPSWRGGAYIEPGKGYRMVRCPDHLAVMARQNGYVLEHRLKMAESIGRPLSATEVVHHIDGDVTNNDLGNLKLYASHREHWVENHMADIIAARNAAG